MPGGVQAAIVNHITSAYAELMPRIRARHQPHTGRVHVL